MDGSSMQGFQLPPHQNPFGFDHPDAKFRQMFNLSMVDSGLYSPPPEVYHFIGDDSIRPLESEKRKGPPFAGSGTTPLT